ncbi:hypothetical protein RRF57_009223 [Xylaria bambusicola]|uniref:Uncharacterized protein n=1 Tax=Xylaria bambusicola TaxID=326684 RepID=A0AAN7UZ59_9PEZI
MDSQGSVAWLDCGNGEKVGEPETVRCCTWGIDEQGQASPREMPFMAVREFGQIGARPAMRTFHNTGRTTTALEAACVVG